MIVRGAGATKTSRRSSTTSRRISARRRVRSTSTRRTRWFSRCAAVAAREAAAVIAYRDKNGLFKSIDDLKSADIDVKIDARKIGYFGGIVPAPPRPAMMPAPTCCSIPPTPDRAFFRSCWFDPSMPATAGSSAWAALGAGPASRRRPVLAGHASARSSPDVRRRAGDGPVARGECMQPARDRAMGHPTTLRASGRGARPVSAHAPHRYRDLVSPWIFIALSTNAQILGSLKDHRSSWWKCPDRDTGPLGEFLHAIVRVHRTSLERQDRA